MITASKLELAERCPGNLTLPHRDESNEYSEAGNERHAEDEEAINSGDVPDAYLERWPGLTWRSEVSYAYDVSTDTGRYLGTGLKRAYGTPRPFEIPGTIDVEGRGHGILVIVDRKSFEEVTPAARNPQVRFLALAASRAHPADKVFVGINHEIYGMDVVEIDPMFDLDVIAHDTKDLLVRSAAVRSAARDGADVAFNTGRWCRWCSAFNDCPKQAELRALMTRDDEDPAIARLTSFLDDEEAPDVYELWKRIGILHKRIGQSLYAYAAARPIQLRTGKVFGPIRKQGNEKLNGDVVYSVVKELHGQAVADNAVVRTATKKQLGVALADVPGVRSAHERAVLDAVRAAGGSKRSEGTSIEEYDPRPRLVEAESK